MILWGEMLNKIVFKISFDAIPQQRKKAIMLGANVLDTSSTYSDGDSERLFGRIISELCDRQDITREVCPYEVDVAML